MELVGFSAFWRDFRENRVAVAALLVVAAILLLAIAAPLFTPQILTTSESSI